MADQFPPLRGGLSSGILALSREQHHRGHDVTVIAADAPGARKVDAGLPFRVIRIPVSSLLRLGWRAAGMIQALDQPPDVIHCHGPTAGSVLLRRRRNSPPVVVTLHAVRKYQFSLFGALTELAQAVRTDTREALRNPPPRYHPWIPRVARQLLIEWFVCTRSDHLALVAGHFGDLVAEYYGVPPSRVTVVYNGSDLEPCPEEGGNLASWLSVVARRDKLVLYVGRLDWVKRAHLLVQAMPAVRQRHPDARLVLVGDGDQRADLERLVVKLSLEDVVSLRGWTAHDELPEIYRCAACLCLPSIWEGLSKVLLEAMSFGIPVLASENRANVELLGDGLGTLVSEPTPDAWAGAIVRALDAEEEVVARARRARSASDRRFRWHHVAERMDEMYERLTARKAW